MGCMPVNASQRFWSRVAAPDPDACWLWTGYIAHNGYGEFLLDTGRGEAKRRRTGAHRFAYQDVHGLLPRNVQVDHRPTCPRHCCNPNHLRPATVKQNGENRRGPTKVNQSGARGVDWHAWNRKWRATVTHHGRQIHVGYFDDIDEAAAAVRVRRNELFTHNDADRR